MAREAAARLVELLRSNWITFSGAMVTTAAFMAMCTLFLLQALGIFGGAYFGMVMFLVLPGLFVIGLLTIPAGLLVYRTQLRERIEILRKKPRQFVQTLALLTTANVVIVAFAGYRGAHYLDSVEFCGTLCHEVMEPQYDAYLRSPHARVACVACHIGPGASWFVKSKLSGVRQVFAVLLDTYPRPVPAPVKNLRPARDTCEQCHWPEKFEGDRLVVRRHFRYDREATPYTNVLVMKTGGVHPGGSATGIHWHIHSGIDVTYRATDEKRTRIPWVKLTDRKAGREEIFTVAGVSPDEPPDGEERTMDCIDCHNQPSHVFERSFKALNNAIASGLISRRLPYIKKMGREALEHEWQAGEAQEGIRKMLETFYSESEPLEGEPRTLLEPAVQEIIAIWERNVYPEMRIQWDTYRSFAGHYGCFRCHDDEHRTREGRPIPLTCETCHVVLSFQEREPAILRSLGYEED